MYPSFEPGVLHYAVRCADATALLVMAKAEAADATLRLLHNGRTAIGSMQAVSSQPEMPNRAKQCCQDAPGADDRVAPETGAARSAARAAGRGQSKRSSVTMLEEPMILVSLAAACRMER